MKRASIKSYLYDQYKLIKIFIFTHPIFFTILISVTTFVVVSGAIGSVLILGGSPTFGKIYKIFFPKN